MKYYKRKDGLYEAIRVVDGKRKAFRARTERGVTKKMLEYQKELEQGRKFTEVADEWFEEKQKEIRSNTIRAYTARLRHIKKEFEGVNIREIVPANIQSFLMSMAKRDSAKQTVQMTKNVLNMIFDYAIISGDIERSPMVGVKLPKHLKHNKREAATEEDQKAVVDSNEDFTLFALLCMYAGLRRSEALAIRYEDISDGWVHVRRHLTWNRAGKPIIDDVLKTDAGKRDVPLLDVLANRLPKGEGLIVNKSGFPLTSSQFEVGWDNFRKHTGISSTPHQFRHVFATLCFDAGIDPKAAAQIMGHEDEKLTRAVYTHITESRQAKTKDQLNRFINDTAATQYPPQSVGNA